jgi:exopolysaccharide biosynthesis polyprenyl glycosylphosphotransferase
VGGGGPAEDLIKRLEAAHHPGIRIIGIFDDRDHKRSPDSVGNHPKLGRVADLVDFARRGEINLVIFTLPNTAEARILQLLDVLRVLPIDVRLELRATHDDAKHQSASIFVGSVAVAGLLNRPISRWGLASKWLSDKIIGSAALFLLSLPLLLIAIAIKLDSPGPVLFRQVRYGFNNELIEIFKFRSMYADQCDPRANQLVSRGDPRVTRIGHWLRKLSLDELPQLFNVVFKGNLSLVGPRPHALEAKAGNRLYEQVVDNYFVRHKVKPGITGWAQINGWRGETDTEEKIRIRVAYDFDYIDNWSLARDFRILMATPVALMKVRNVY